MTRWLCRAQTTCATLTGILALLAFTADVQPATTSDVDIVRIEEDWELVLLSPDPNSVGPQVTCVLSTQGDVEGLFAAFEINHRTLPQFKPGGMQLQLWNNDLAIKSAESPNIALLNLPDEKVTWTQTMSLADDSLLFEIKNGSSQTWGNFGGQGHLQHSVTTDLTNLNTYDPNVSVKNSGVGFAANRVQSLILKRVRMFTADGQVLEDDTQRIVHE